LTGPGIWDIIGLERRGKHATRKTKKEKNKMARPDCGDAL